MSGKVSRDSLCNAEQLVHETGDAWGVRTLSVPAVLPPVLSPVPLPSVSPSFLSLVRAGICIDIVTAAVIASIAATAATAITTSICHIITALTPLNPLTPLILVTRNRQRRKRGSGVEIEVVFLFRRSKHLDARHEKPASGWRVGGK